MASPLHPRAGGPRLPLADAALALPLLGIVALMIIPIPTPLLDVLIAANIALGVLMLLVAMAIKDGLAFTAMPTVLLVTTLYRLALNVSSTRLILLQADAGHVIHAFGAYVVRGNYAVGAVIFFILTLIQYVVVARGSERVAEVGARFTLDAMPGKQMAIDADLRSGALSPEGARRRRRALEREGQFYGAMDGAMKFVKGDAIAGIVITLVNIVAGVGIGMGMRKLGLVQSLQLYGLLTIGDGLVCQIPSLLISTSAGLVVTRVAGHEEGASLGSDVGRQLFGNPRVLALGGGFLAFLSLVPGLPMLPFAFLGALLGAAAYGVRRAERRGGARDEPLSETTEPVLPEPCALALELGSELASQLEHARGEPLRTALGALREQLYLELGVPLPALRVRARTALPARGYALLLAELPCARGGVPQGASPREAAEALAGATAAALLPRAAELLDLQATQGLLDALERSAPALVHEVVPKPVSLRLLAEVLRRLLAEGVSIRPLARILELLGREAAASSDPAALVEGVRQGLSRQISFAHAPQGTLALHPVDVMIEDALRDAVAAGSAAAPPALPPEQTRDIVAAVRAALDSHADQPGAVLVTQPDVRRHLRALLEGELPQVAVLSYPELAPELQVERRAPIRID